MIFLNEGFSNLRIFVATLLLSIVSAAVEHFGFIRPQLVLPSIVSAPVKHFGSFHPQLVLPSIVRADVEENFSSFHPQLVLPSIVSLMLNTLGPFTLN